MCNKVVNTPQLIRVVFSVGRFTEASYSTAGHCSPGITQWLGKPGWMLVPGRKLLTQNKMMFHGNFQKNKTISSQEKLLVSYI